MIPAITHCANRALDSLRTLHGKPLLPGVEGGHLLSQRATLMGLEPHDQCSANGQCHLWPCQDGQWVALNLSRPHDWELLPALFQHHEPLTQLTEVAQQVQLHPSGYLVKRGRTLGLAIAIAGHHDPANPCPWFNITTRGPQLLRQGIPRVVDLSALWAGPLCSHLLQQCGAQVIKVESIQRPDGARLNRQRGAQDFYRQLNQNKTLRVLDFNSTTDIRQLSLLIEQADIIIEASRPRALRQLGIHAEDIVANQTGKIWVSITGYGRAEPEANWIAYGDDAAVAAGLCHWENGKPAFIGDAMADPLAGLHAALAAYTFWQQHESALLDINLCSIARYCANNTGC